MAVQAQQQSFAATYPMLGELMTSGISVGTGVIITNPVGALLPAFAHKSLPSLGPWHRLPPNPPAWSRLADVVKIRQQLAGQGRNMLVTGVQVVRDEGALAMYRGVTAAVARGMFYGGATLEGIAQYIWTPV